MTPQGVLSSPWSTVVAALLSLIPCPPLAGINPQIKLPACKPSISSSSFLEEPKPRQLLSCPLPTSCQEQWGFQWHVWQFCGQKQESFCSLLSQLKPRQLDGMNVSDCHTGRALSQCLSNGLTVELFCKQNPIHIVGLWCLVLLLKELGLPLGKCLVPICEVLVERLLSDRCPLWNSRRRCLSFLSQRQAQSTECLLPGVDLEQET